MQELRELKPYSDNEGNVVIYEGVLPPQAKVAIKFRGSGNVVQVAENAKIVDLAIEFAGSGGRVQIGGTHGQRTGLRFNVRIGHSSSLTVGDDVGCESRTFVRASEGAAVTIGDDCMFAAGIEIRADDTHAIYDVRTEKRVNPARAIDIGAHVWLGKDVTVMGGASIGSGSVVGFGSVVTRDVPNNCVAAGVPARVVRRDIAWERPELHYRLPGIEGLAPGQKKSVEYWNLTVDDTE
ncbi:hypothetical protein GCM10022288_10210 [Gryllotalpicola kribbensis]|uniref:Acyltransferase n=1 Tax=Gryllotalpicola kribbensis TaxID=993084 RepID=A0ABP8AMN4_9MICO